MLERALPANPAKGRVEDLLAGILQRDRAQPIDYLFTQVPPGWSRMTVLSALQEGVLAGWVGAHQGRFFLVADPPAPSAEDADPTHVRWKNERLRDLCHLLGTRLGETLHDLQEAGAPVPLLAAAADLRREALRVQRGLEAA